LIRNYFLTFGAPWQVREIEDGFVVANDGTHLAYVYGRNPGTPKAERNTLLYKEAKALAVAIALLPYHPPRSTCASPACARRRGSGDTWAGSAAEHLPLS
jgi:hypothetical protein